MKALEVSDVSISYNGSLAIDKVSFDVNEGDLLGIVGPNGAGKTTLFRAILGLQGYSGVIRLFGYEAKKYYPLLPLIGYVSQKVNFEPNFPATVSEVVAMGRPFLRKRLDKISTLLQKNGYSWNRVYSKLDKNSEKVLQALKTVNLDSLKDKIASCPAVSCNESLSQKPWLRIRS